MILSIIIVSYNTKDLTLQTIKSAISDIKNSDLLKNEAEILVVDNNSTDDSVKSIRDFKLNQSVPIRVLSQKENLGFGKANNLGIEKSTGKYILLLNSDTIVRKNALETMVKRFENNHDYPKLGILAATLLNPDLSLQTQGGSFPNLFNLFIHMSMIDDLPLIGNLFPSTQHTGKNNRQSKYYSFEDWPTVDVKSPASSTIKSPTNSSAKSPAIYHPNQNHQLIKIDWVGGTAMMIPRLALQEFGELDQNIFMYGEDTEICIRANNHGYLVAIDPDAQVIHLKNQSSSSENAIKGEFNAYIYIFSKHKTRLQIEFVRIFLQMGAILRIIVFSTIAKNKQKKTIYSNILKDLGTK